MGSTLEMRTGSEDENMNSAAVIEASCVYGICN